MMNIKSDGTTLGTDISVDGKSLVGVTRLSIVGNAIDDVLDIDVSVFAPKIEIKTDIYKIRYDLSEVTNEQLLAELIRRNKPHDAPKRRTFVTPHSEVVVGIGNDWHATINIDNDALERLSNE